jgi:transposase
MTRRYGRSLRGSRVVDSVPHGHWKTTTFLAALRHNGLTAPAVFDGAIDGESFKAYIEQNLAPTLQPGDIVIMDNLSCHKIAGIDAAIYAKGAVLLYLPPYSPDFNPIEQVFAKLKQLLRSAAKRTIDELWNAIGKLVSEFSQQECLNYFRHCGYNATSKVNPL